MLLQTKRGENCFLSLEIWFYIGYFFMILLAKYCLLKTKNSAIATTAAVTYILISVYKL